MNHSKEQLNRFPIHGWIGLTITIFSWAGNWTLIGVRTHLLFFPMWLGYILVMDGLVFKRKGHSILTRDSELFFVLFLISIPVWWVFEILNEFTRNWSYIGKNFFHPLEYFVLSSISFSTVMPAIFETSEFIGSFSFIQTFTKNVKSPQKFMLLLFFIFGWILFIAIFIQPKYFFPALWIAPFFILDPINAWKGRVSLIQKAQQGDWRILFSLWGGTLICGFFWEMWNYYSYPKWIYHIPYVDYVKIFEMPILGYLGYLPFSLALFACFVLTFKIKNLNNFKSIQIAHDSDNNNS